MLESNTDVQGEDACPLFICPSCSTGHGRCASVLELVLLPGVDAEDSWLPKEGQLQSIG